MHCLTVEADCLKNLVSVVEDCSAGCLINAAALHTNETIFNEVSNADTVLAAQLIELPDEVNAVKSFAVNLCRDTLFKA